MSISLKPVSFTRMKNAVEKVQDRLLRTTKTLEEAKIPYAVIGGNAVAAWVSKVDESAVRNTRDVDILLNRSDLEKARVAMERKGFKYRRISIMGGAGHLDVFLDRGENKIRETVRLLFAEEIVREGDPVPAPSVNEYEDDPKFRLISLEALVRTKLVAFRDKDRMHLRDMIDIGLIDQTWKEKYPSVLAEKLQHLLDNPE